MSLKVCEEANQGKKKKYITQEEKKVKPADSSV